MFEGSFLLNLDLHDAHNIKIAARTKFVGFDEDSVPKYQLTLVYPGTPEYRARILTLLSDLIRPHEAVSLNAEGGIPDAPTA